VGILALQGGRMSTTSNRPSVSLFVIVSVLFSRPIVSPLSPFAIRFCSASTPNRLLSSPLAVVFVCFLPGSDSLLTSTRYRLCFVASVDSSIRFSSNTPVLLSSFISFPLPSTPFCSTSPILILSLPSLLFCSCSSFAYSEIYSASLLIYLLVLRILFCFSLPSLLSTLLPFIS